MDIFENYLSKVQELFVDTGVLTKKIMNMILEKHGYKVYVLDEVNLLPQLHKQIKLQESFGMY